MRIWIFYILLCKQNRKVLLLTPISSKQSVNSCLHEPTQIEWVNSPSPIIRISLSLHFLSPSQVIGAYVARNVTSELITCEHWNGHPKNCSEGKRRILMCWNFRETEIEFYMRYSSSRLQIILANSFESDFVVFEYSTRTNSNILNGLQNDF